MQFEDLASLVMLVFQRVARTDLPAAAATGHLHLKLRLPERYPTPYRRHVPLSFADNGLKYRAVGSLPAPVVLGNPPDSPAATLNWLILEAHAVSHPCFTGTCSAGPSQSKQGRLRPASPLSPVSSRRKKPPLLHP